MDRESVNDILTRQCATIDFENGKVKYFSLSTQHGQADSIQEAVDIILASDKEWDGKSPLKYMVDKLEEKELPDMSDLDFDLISEKIEGFFDFRRNKNG